MKTEDYIGGAVFHAGRGIAGGMTQVAGQGRGSRRMGKKLQATDGQREPVVF